MGTQSVIERIELQPTETCHLIRQSAHQRVAGSRSNERTAQEPEVRAAQEPEVWIQQRRSSKGDRTGRSSKGDRTAVVAPTICLNGTGRADCKGDRTAVVAPTICLNGTGRADRTVTGRADRTNVTGRADRTTGRADRTAVVAPTICLRTEYESTGRRSDWYGPQIGRTGTGRRSDCG